MSRLPVPKVEAVQPRPVMLEPPASRAPATHSRQPGSVGSARTHVLTVALEDYFHVTPLETVIRQDRWSRFEMRLEASTRRVLDLLDECSARATFFVLGWVADAAPELVREVAARGHEVASKGYYHRDIRGLGREAFREDAVRARERQTPSIPGRGNCPTPDAPQCSWRRAQTTGTGCQITQSD